MRLVALLLQLALAGAVPVAARAAPGPVGKAPPGKKSFDARSPLFRALLADAVAFCESRPAAFGCKVALAELKRAPDQSLPEHCRGRVVLAEAEAVLSTGCNGGAAVTYRRVRDRWTLVGATFEQGGD